MPKPNIVLIVSDDHGYADRGATGIHDDVRTPSLDRLAAEDVTMTDAYVTAPICSPSRAGIMTGLYQQRWGGLWFDTARFPDDESIPTVAEDLRDAGYRTGYFGKVHYGDEKPGERPCPPHHGFDDTLYGLAGQSFGRLHYLHHSEAAIEEHGEIAGRRMAVQPMLDGDDEVDVEGFLTAELGRRAREFIGADDGRPFFCMLAFNAVHNFCWQLPPDELESRGLPAYADWDAEQGKGYGEWYDDSIVPNLPHGREYYLAQLELMDAEIGKILDQLDAAGLSEDTVVVYLTDNGGSTCNYGSNAPLRGTKYTLWEGGVRTPMLWWWPGTLPGGEEVSSLASALDVAPTLRHLASAASAAQTDGIDLLPAFLGSARPERVLHWDCGFQFAVREGAWKLSWVSPDSPEVAELAALEHAPMGEGWSLNNLAEDIGEENNLIFERPDVAERLLDAHSRWMDEIGLPRRKIRLP